MQLAYNAEFFLQEMLHTATLLCEAASGPVHWALLSAEAQESDSHMYHSLLVAFCAVQSITHNQLTLSEKEVMQFLSDNGIEAAVTSSAAHVLLRPSKRRKSHKHKRRKSHKTQRRSLPEDWDPGSGDDSLSDGDLGIMADDDHDKPAQAAAVWQLGFAGSRPQIVHANAAEVPSILLWHVSMQWLETLQRSGLLC